MILSRSECWEHLKQARKELLGSLELTPSTSYYEQKLRAVWNRARRSKAYRHLGDFNPAAFSSLPVTTKDVLKTAPWSYMATDIGMAAKYYETTGSSGRVTPTPRMAEDIIWNTVSVAEAWRQVLGEDDRVLILLPSDVVPVADLVAGVCEYLGMPHTRAYPMTTGISDWARVIGLWSSLRPTAIFVAPGLLLQLGRLLKQQEVFGDLAASVRTLMLLGEVSTDQLRTRLAREWRAQVYDASYGSTETGTLAATCRAGRQHLLTAANFFEVRTPDGVRSLDDADRGELIVTPLNLFARPLLRLGTGDEATLRRDCRCGHQAPSIAISGRASDVVRLHGVALSIRGVEEVVYGASQATGYLIEVSPAGDYSRLVLERDVGWDRGAEPAMRASIQRSSEHDLGVCWDDVVFVNALPVITKSGASQKSWKRSNIRVLEPTQ